MELSPPVRVREIISHLDVSDLGPLKWETISAAEPKKPTRPRWVLERKSFDAYGCFVDALIREMLGHLDDLGWKDRLYPICVQELERFPQYTVPDKDEVHKSFGWFTNLWKWLGSEPIFRDTPAELAPEWILDSIAAHPDLVLGGAVLDIKTTVNFDRMAPEAALQVYSYFCIARALGKPVKRCGVVLPLQQEIRLLDVSEFSEAAFLGSLTSVALSASISRDAELELLLAALVGQRAGLAAEPESGPEVRLLPFCALEGLFREPPFQTLGNHVSKVKGSVSASLALAVQKWGLGGARAVQMFLRPSRSGGTARFRRDDLNGALEVVSQAGMRFFCHTPYIINLCCPRTAKSSLEVDPYLWALSTVRQDLRITRRVAGKGVVIHVGKALNMGPDPALAAMKRHMLLIMVDATEDCPLLLETPAGQGAETLTTVEEMAEFYLGFSEDQRKVLGICVDTCHVFACGYEPVEYLVALETAVGGGVIKLVHFNNSKGAKGSRKDRHARIHHGQISLAELEKVDIWCKDRGVPTVME